MKERPILFSAPMVRALLAGTKTQTRRALREQPPPEFCCGDVAAITNGTHWSISKMPGRKAWHPDPHPGIACPYGQPGDRLWVREAFAQIDGQTQAWIETDYRATYNHGDRLGDSLGIKKRWTPSIHMPRAASRILLEITEVHVERLQCISEADAIAEGIFRKTGRTSIGDIVETAEGDEPIYAFPTQAREHYRRLWDSINGHGAWKANPWVWAVSFLRVAP